MANPSVGTDEGTVTMEIPGDPAVDNEEGRAAPLHSPSQGKKGDYWEFPDINFGTYLCECACKYTFVIATCTCMYVCCHSYTSFADG